MIRFSEEIYFDNPFLNASGCWDTTFNNLMDLLDSVSGGIVSKSGTLIERYGNELPRFKTVHLGAINSMGLSNMGFKFYTSILSKSKPYIQSIAPFSSDEMIFMLDYISNYLISKNITKSRLIEINLSYPNSSNNSIIIFENLDEYLDKLKINIYNNLIIGLKLPPYYLQKDFDEVSAKIINCKQIKFITTINCITNGLIIHNEKSVISSNNGLGGISGTFIKPTALANVWQFYKRFKGKIKIIGVGGIENAEDAFQHILCGADLVQIGTQLMKEGPEIFNKINNDFKELIIKKGYTHIDEFKGKLQII